MYTTWASGGSLVAVCSVYSETKPTVREAQQWKKMTENTFLLNVSGTDNHNYLESNDV